MIAENIVALRRREKISQEKLAEAVGVSRQTIAKWEAGESVPDVIYSSQLADFFDISLDDLVHVEGSINPSSGKRQIYFWDCYSG